MNETRDYVKAAHAFFRGQTVMAPEPTATTETFRAAIRSISEARCGVAERVGEIREALASVKADLARLDATLEIAGARERGTIRSASEGRVTEAMFKAGLTVRLASKIEERAALEESEALLTGALEHGRMVLAELQFAFDATSRMLATLQLEASLVRSGDR